MKRRQVLTTMGATALIAPEIFTASFGLARAQTRPLTFCSWGGALSEMEKTTMLDPFAKLKRLEFAYASPTNYAKIKAMVESGAPEWDMVDVGGFFIFQGKSLLETLDMSLIPNAKKLDPGWVTSKGIYTSTGATVMAWNTNAFPANKGPTSWKDFWDIKAFPGPRGLYKQLYYNYEAALLAAGVPLNEVYPATDEKIKLVFQKLREIKPHVKVWWTAGAQPGQLLSSGELALCSAWTGRILSVMKEKAPVAMTYSQGIAWGNAWVVLKGAPNAKLAMEAINYAISEEAQMRLLDNGTYGPSLSSAAAKATAEQRKVLVTAPENAKQMVITDEEQVAIYREKFEAEWNKFLLS